MKLTEELKTRVSKDTKRELGRLADDRHLDVSDVVREALREYLEKPTVKFVREGRTVKA